MIWLDDLEGRFEKRIPRVHPGLAPLIPCRVSPDRMLVVGPFASKFLLSQGVQRLPYPWWLREAGSLLSVEVIQAVIRFLT
jgi:hypothetical protein